ncbi:hypothetical protein EDD52_1341 [Primorskyibacter sedentarius]|uniref:Uncharacterized protein n=1 Tax=Primorskyibacter sedentarius TaxID=745311 RepID=A0A4R3IVB5_9RHOB|nr:hypothetical protein [Primorskyibacter sedentarius]TCS53958.1 hypothetical protein EDD52_1341 [Primorskyibacter sedentarius]
MKRLMLATALTAATISGAAFANEAQEVEIETFAPNVSYELLSEDARLQISNIIAGGDSYSEKQSKVTAVALNEGALIENDTTVYVPADAGETTFASDLKDYEPSVDASELDKQTKLRLSAVMYGSGTHSEKASQVKAILLNS